MGKKLLNLNHDVLLVFKFKTVINPNLLNMNVIKFKISVTNQDEVTQEQIVSLLRHLCLG